MGRKYEEKLLVLLSCNLSWHNSLLSIVPCHKKWWSWNFNLKIQVTFPEEWLDMSQKGMRQSWEPSPVGIWFCRVNITDIDQKKSFKVKVVGVKTLDFKSWSWEKEKKTPSNRIACWALIFQFPCHILRPIAPIFLALFVCYLEHPISKQDFCTG